VINMTDTTENPTSYSAGPNFTLRLPGSRLRCRCCGRTVSAYAFDVIEAGFIRAVCTNCCNDLLVIELR
jgi:hypothetical protein